MEHIIEIEHLSKAFGEIRAVDDISFCVKKGELFAFLGVNGAGKSTTISMLCGQLKKDHGTITVCGRDSEHFGAEIRRRIGVVFQNSLLDAPLSVKDNLMSRAALYGITGNAFSRRLSELSELLEFSGFLSQPVGRLSGGQRRRIDIARALLHEPEILILDEPTTGLDPQTRRLLQEIIGRLRREKEMTVFLTTHYMEEVSDADYIVIMDRGKIAAEGTPRELKNAYAGDYLTVYGAEEKEIARLGLPYEMVRDAFRISIPDPSRAVELIMADPDLFSDFEMTKGKMDDVFLAATGKKLTGGEEK